MGATKTRKATCDAILTIGARAGEPCGATAVEGSNPPRCRRHADESMPDKIRQQKKALACAAYAETGVVSRACTMAGISRATFYEWLDSDPEFATAAMAAAEEAADGLETEAHRRAVYGTVKPLMSGGKMVLDDVGEPVMLREYSDTLLIFLLKARRPARFRERYDVTVAPPDTGIPVVAANGEQVEDPTHARILASLQQFKTQAIETTGTEVPTEP